MGKNQIKNLHEIQPLDVSVKDYKHYHYMLRLMEELRKRELPVSIVDFINTHIDLINYAVEKKFELKKQLKASQKAILKMLEKQLKVVTKNHYRNLWMALGMSVFGVPIGVVYGQITDNMGMMGVGIAIGMTIGLAFGSSLDKKAANEGRQLNIESNA